MFVVITDTESDGRTDGLVSGGDMRARGKSGVCCGFQCEFARSSVDGSRWSSEVGSGGDRGGFFKNRPVQRSVA